MDEVAIDIKEERDIIAARRAGRDLARTHGFGLADQTRLATAISELVRNVVQYAGTGRCVITGSSQSEMSMRVLVEDNGPGIDDLELAMTDGYSTGKGLGVGLPAVKRLVDEFEIGSRPGHTRVVIVIRRHNL